MSMNEDEATAATISPIRQEMEVLLKNISLIQSKVNDLAVRLDFVSIRGEQKAENEAKPEGYGINMASNSQLGGILKKANRDLNSIANDLMALQKTLQI